MKKLIITSIFLVPLASLISIPGTIVWYSQVLMFIFLCCIGASIKFFEINKSIALLLIYLMFSYIVICHQDARSMFCMVLAYLGIGLIYIVSKIKDRKSIYLSILIFSILQIIYVGFQATNHDPFFHSIWNNNADTVGFAGSHNQLGIYYSAVAPIFMSYNWILVLLVVIPIYFSHCSSAAIGIITGVILFVRFSNKNLRFRVSCLSLIIFLIFSWKSFDNVPSKVIDERLNLWKLTISQVTNGKALAKVNDSITNVVTCNPLFGFGVGSFMPLSPLTQEKIIINGANLPDGSKAQHRYEHAHNDLVEAYFEYGLIGLILVLMAILEVLWKFFLCVNKSAELITIFCCLVSQGVTSMGVYSIHAPLSYFMFCLNVGLFYGAYNACKDK